VPTHIAFLRAVNIKPRWVKMDVLRTVLEDSGFRDVETYIQSGNVRVTTATRSTAKVEKHLREVISREFGFDVPVVVRTAAQLRGVLQEVEGMESPITAEVGRYVTFMSGDLGPEGVQALHDWDVVTEAARVLGNDVVLFLVSGVQGAKLTNARIEKLTGAVGTTRNLTVVRSLVERWCS
jgi:uncharacterized protein (DUF1697 family)